MEETGKKKSVGERIKSGIKDIFTGILSNVIYQWAPTLVAGAAGILGWRKFFKIQTDIVGGSGISTPDKIIIIICASICGAGLLISICSYIFVHYHQKKMQAILATTEAELRAEQEKLKTDGMVPAFPRLETQYVIQHVEFELHFRDRENIIQRHTVKYVVKDKPLKFISHTMHWTGSGYLGSKLQSKSLNKGYTLEEEHQGGGMHNISIALPEEKTAGFSDEYAFETELLDEEHQMKPVLARIIKCQTNHLTLKVTVPKGLIMSCEKYVSADIPCEFILKGPETIKPESVGDNDCYRFSVESPELLRFYGIRWKFKD